MTNILELAQAQIEAHDDQRDLGPAGERRLVAALKHVLPMGARLLDAGGGSGSAVPVLRAAGAEVVLLDWSRSMLSVARERTAVPAVRGDLTHLPFPAASFDTVHVAYVVQNVTDWQLALQECVRVLRAGGLLLVAWGEPPGCALRHRLEQRYFDLLGPAAGVRGEHAGLTRPGAELLLDALDVRPAGTITVEGVQSRSPRQLLERVAANPYRVQATEEARRHALAHALAGARRDGVAIDEPQDVPVTRTLHLYRASTVGRAGP